MARRPNRTDPEQHRQQMAAASRARYRAECALIEENREEFDRLYAHYGAQQDPPVTPAGRRLSEEEQIVAEIERLQKLLDEVEAEGDG